MNLELYNADIICKTNSMISGKHEELLPHTDSVFNEIRILKSFLEDDDIQEIKLCSTNIGFVKSFTKSYRTK